MSNATSKPAAPPAQAPVEASAEERAAVEGVIRHHVAALNSADEAAIAADWEPRGTLVDAFPPFVWAGDAPWRTWWRDLRQAIGHAGLDKVVFSLGDWQRVYVRAGRAYLVVNATAVISGPAFAVEAKGSWTFVLRKTGQRWKIASWTWGGPPAAPVRHP